MSFFVRHMTGVLCTCLTLGVFGTLILFPDRFAVQGYPPTVHANTAEKNIQITQNIPSHTINLDDIVVISTDDRSESVVTYVVQPGDTLSDIAHLFGTTTKILKETNDIVNEKHLRVGHRIFVSETPGFVYQLESVTNLMVFANQYDIDLTSLSELNNIVDAQETLYQGTEIFLPLDREKGIELGLLPEPEPIVEPEPVVVQNKPTTVVRRQTTQPVQTQQVVRVQAPVATNTQRPPSNVSYTSDHIVRQWTYAGGERNSFYRGYCTRGVAVESARLFPYVSDTQQIRPFGGDGGEWLVNAQRAGYYTSSTPSVDAIMVVAPHRGNSYGHVAMVKQVDRANKRILVRDMNFKKKFVFTERRVYMDDTMTKVVKNSAPISGFIPRQPHPQWFQEKIDSYNQ